MCVSKYIHILSQYTDMIAYIFLCVIAIVVGIYVWNNYMADPLQFIGWVKNDNDTLFLYFHTKTRQFLVSKSSGAEKIVLETTDISNGQSIFIGQIPYIVIIDK